ncbi:hypothetical protein HanPI659440_Chr05g0218861 [Helianthus annuus]|nr:hypothetical protein HanPI659440_Chr05g0218861 [Helianthus annuus]
MFFKIITGTTGLLTAPMALIPPYFCHGPRPGLTRFRSRGTEIPRYLI